MSEDRALSEFLQEFDSRKQKESKKAHLEVQLIEAKRKELRGLRKLLQRFVDMGLVVLDSRIGEPGYAPNATQKFAFYEGESSPTWGPGVSLYFDHPAQVEIAIPNEIDKAKEGCVVMRSVTQHKDRIMLHQQFADMEQAKENLAKFLGKNAVSIERDPRIAMAASRSSVSVIGGRIDPSVLSSAPKEPPKEKD